MDSGTKDRLGRKTSGSTVRAPKLLGDIADVETAVGDEEEGKAADVVEYIVISDGGRTSMWGSGIGSVRKRELGRAEVGMAQG